MKEVFIVLVCGKWISGKPRWLFVLDKSLGSRLVTAVSNTSYEELVSMVFEDYGLDNRFHEIELSFMLPKDVMAKLPPDQPPIYMKNTRHLLSFLSHAKNNSVRLCVEVKNKVPKEEKQLEAIVERDLVVEREPILERVGYEEEQEEDNDSSEEDEEDMRFDYCEDSDGTDSADENFAEYGVKDEDREANLKAESSIFVIDGYDNNNLPKYDIGSISLREGQCYDTKEHLEVRLKMLSVIEKFDFNVYKSTPQLLSVKCWVKGCIWKVRATPIDDWPRFHVRSYVSEHTCSVTERSARTRQASHDVLAILYKDYVGEVGPTVMPMHVADALNKRFQVKIEYWKAYRTLRHARDLVRGTHEDGYTQLPAYLYMIKRANPGTISVLEVDENQRFKYMFISFGASIKGFQFLRKVVVVDGTFLQGKYKGTLLTATGQDGNFQIYPIAFAIVDTENDDSWEWFFNQLSGVIPDDDGLAIISDRHKSIGRAIGIVYPKSNRGICTYHLYKNILVKFRGRDAFGLVKKAANAYRLVDFQTAFEQIKLMKPLLHGYLEKADVKLWTRVHFPGDRYNLLTSNIAESMNNVLRRARSLPIVQLLEVIRSMMTRWFSNRRNDAMKMKTILTRGAEKLLESRIDYAKLLNVQDIDACQVQVTGTSSVHVVNLGERKCSCCRFDKEMLPCAHAIAAAEAGKISRISCCHWYFFKENLIKSYSIPIMPRDFGQPIPENVVFLVSPPVVKPQPGRPKKKRTKSALEKALQKKKLRKEYTCGACNKGGHNRKTCPMG